MINPIKLISVCLLTLISACGESANHTKSLREVSRAVTPQVFVGETKQDQPVRFVAGLQPNQRPADAPVIQEFTPSADWRKQALAGISDPIPDSLNFLDNQGAWYTPFNRLGMPGYYDLRNLHRTRNTNPTSNQL